MSSILATKYSVNPLALDSAASATASPANYTASAATPQARHKWLYVAALAVVAALIIWLIFFKK